LPRVCLQEKGSDNSCKCHPERKIKNALTVSVVRDAAKTGAGFAEWKKDAKKHRS
jgi:hypothetical protein